MTMKNPAPEKKQSAPEKQAPKKRRKRSRGVPNALVAALLVIALFFGGLFGFIIANKTNKYAAELEEARARIASLENYLTMMGFSEETSDPESWVFDDSGATDEFGDLGGEEFGDGTDPLWDDSGLLEGMLALEGDPVVIAEFKGGQVMSDEIIDPYNDALATQLFGFSDAEEVSGDVLEEVLQTLVADRVMYAKAEELGLTTLTAEDEAAIKEEAQEYYDEQKEFYASSVDTEGMSAADADAAVDAYMASDVGVTLEGLIEELKKDYWIQKLYNHVGAGITASEEEVQAAYTQLVEDQKALFTEYPEEYEYAIMSGETIAYNLENYRRVKHILLTFEDYAVAEQVQALTDSVLELDPETQMAEIEALQEELDKLYADLEAKAQSVIDELNAGADFDAMIEKYGMDEGMAFEPTKTEGYYVSSNSIQWAADFVEGCMILDEVGQVSTPVRSVSGVHIIKYIGDVVPGQVPMNAIHDQLTAEVVTAKQDAAYEAQVSQWLSDAAPTYYPERLQ